MAEKQRSSLDVVRILQVCRDIEMYCAEIYHVYEDRFRDDEELRALWTKTRAEEENHARQFVLAINMRAEGAVTEIHVEMDKATQVLTMLKGIYDKILLQPPDKIEALLLAIKLEEKLAEFHLEAVAAFADEKLKKMFHSMMQADNAHVAAIEQMYQKRLAAERNG